MISIKMHFAGPCYGFRCWREFAGQVRLELRAFMEALGQPPYRGAQLYHALYAERRFDLAAMSNLPASLRERLASEARIATAADHSPASVLGWRRPLRVGAFAGRLRGRCSCSSRRKSGDHRNGFHALAESPNHLHLDASGLRSRLPLLPDRHARADSQPNCGRNCGSGAGGSRRQSRRARSHRQMSC